MPPSKLALYVLRHCVAVGLTGLLGVVFYFALTLEFWIAPSASDGYLLIMLPIGFVLSGAAALVGWSRWYLAPLALYVLAVIGIRLVPVCEVRALMDVHNEIEQGMTQAQVQAIVDRHFPSEGRFQVHLATYSPAMLGWYVDDGRGTTTGLSVRFVDNACVNVSFQPD